MRFNEFVTEADIIRKRQPEHPDVLGYEMKGKTKKATAAGLFDQVIVTLKGGLSKHFTDLARQFNRVKEEKERLAAEEKKFKAVTRQAFDELFDPADEVLTRVVETASLVMKISKAEERIAEKLDEEGYLAELEKLTGLAADELEKIRDKYITTITTQVEPKVLAPKEKKVKKESYQIDEGVMDNIRSYAAKVKRRVMSWLSKWDARFADLKSKIEAEL